jgi:acyl-CoA thioester hydrolase
MQHVNNTVYVRWMETARFEYFEKVKLQSMGAQSGRTGILKSIDCNFRLPLTWPDKVLVGGKVIELGKDYFVIQHVVFSCNHQKVAAHSKAVIVGFDYGKQKKCDFPPGLVEKIQKLEGMT